MSKLPKGFPEYSIMYKTIVLKIKELSNELKNTEEKEIPNIKKKIRNYQTELNRIKEKFPEGFLKITKKNKYE